MADAAAALDDASTAPAAPAATPAAETSNLRRELISSRSIFFDMILAFLGER
jgi:hypothetical protein